MLWLVGMPLVSLLEEVDEAVMDDLLCKWCSKWVWC